MTAGSTVAGTFHDCRILDEESGREMLRIGSRVIDSRVDLASLIKQNNIPTSSMVFRNEIDWLELPSWFLNTEKGDYGIALLVAQNGEWCFVDEVMSVYRRHAGGIWTGQNSRVRMEANLRFWAMLLECRDFREQRAHIRARRKELLRAYGIQLGREGKPLQAVATFLRGFEFSRAWEIFRQVTRKEFVWAAARAFSRLKRKRRI